METETKTQGNRFSAQERELISKREELQARFDEHRTGVLVEREPDDEAAEATENYSKDLAVAILERELQTLDEVNGALKRMKAGEYGVCDTCGNDISAARLRALPWARSCIRCAERGSAND